jgi:hypothetical protein
LLLDEAVQQALGERHFELLTYDDPIVFRYEYESRYRALWDRGESTANSLIVRTATDLNRLPADLIQTGRPLSVGLGQLFPQLSYAVVAALDRGDLDALWLACGSLGARPLGDRATRDVVLRYTFGIDRERVRTARDLLELLL